MRRALVGLAVLACAVGSAASAPPGPAAGSAPEAAGYWTDTRMAQAREADDPAALRGAAESTRVGAAPGTSRLTAPAPVTLARTWTGGGTVSRSVGRVFFSLRGRDYSCTGTAVRSVNRSTVVTAGHCVNAGPGAYVRNWAFVPGYRSGVRPYGTWYARSLAAPAAWVRSGRLQDDIGYAVVAPRAGRRLTDVVGGLPLAFDQPRGAYLWAFGYPAAAPNSGRRALYCRGTVRQDRYGSGAQGLACTMGQGGSGGPWLAGFSTTTRTGRVYAVTSFTYRGMSNVIWAPYLGRTAARLFATVQRR
jgi:V8-like Glu-specific endopeptidase